MTSNSSSKYKTFIMVTDITCSTSCNHRLAAKLCTLETRFVSGVQSDSKRWTQLNSKWHLNTRQTVGCFIPSSLLALQVDLCGLCSKLSWIHLTFSSDTHGRPELLPLHRQPTCSNWWFHWQMLFLGGWMLKQRWNACCTAVADSVLMNSWIQKIVCCIVTILLSTDAVTWLCTRWALWQDLLFQMLCRSFTYHI